MDRFRPLSTLMLGLGLTALVLAACDSGTEAPSPTAETGAADTMAVEPGEAREPDVIPAERYPELAEGVVAEVPEDFPDDVALYPGAVPAQGKGSSTESGPMAALQLMTLDSPDRVYSFYVDQLERDGWTIEEREGLADKNAVTASKGGCTASMLAAPSADGGSDIFIVTDCSGH